MLKVRSIAIHPLVIQQKAEVLHATKQAKNYDINPTDKKAKKELVIKKEEKKTKIDLYISIGKTEK